MKTKTGNKYKSTLIACYMGFITQAIASNFAPLLFTTFHREFGIPLGRMALISTVFYLTQLLIDLFCAKFVDRIGYRRAVVFSEIFSAAGRRDCHVCSSCPGRGCGRDRGPQYCRHDLPERRRQPEGRRPFGGRLPAGAGDCPVDSGEEKEGGVGRLLARPQKTKASREKPAFKTNTAHFQETGKLKRQKQDTKGQPLGQIPPIFRCCLLYGWAAFAEKAAD